jgi:hypothetical protein
MRNPTLFAVAFGLVIVSILCFMAGQPRLRCPTLLCPRLLTPRGSTPTRRGSHQ